VSGSRYNPEMAVAAMLLLALVCGATAQAPVPGAAQAPANTKPHASGAAVSQGTASAPTGKGADDAAKPSEGVLVDQVIAVVNNDLILESDVDQERRFGAFQPISSPEGDFSRAQAIQRLIDRALILQQARLQPDQTVTPAEVKAELDQLRKDIPACKQYHCETDAGWDKFVHDQGFTMQELTQRWQERMQILKFVEMRFRMGIRIEPAAIKDFYNNTLLPEYARQKATPPPLDAISDRIQEVLLQQQVGKLLDDWLQSLKAQGSVRMMKPGEVQP
jgi:peptidyl-prolyl cis-trans isomerase SurA